MKRGPRGGLRKSGACLCDVPTLDSVKAVRQFARDLGTCSYCGERGLRLLNFAGRPMHVRCVVRTYGVSVLALMEDADKRVCLSCLTKRQWEEWRMLVERKRGDR